MADDGTETRDAAQAIAAIVEAVPVYQDVLQPAARQVGLALETVAKTVHIALAPVSALVWGYDQIRDFVTRRVAEKLVNVPPERIRAPLPQVAGPALEALRYTGHDETLRELYANLLATSLDSSTAESAHPSFVEIIRGMAPDEGRIMGCLADGIARPVLEIRAVNKERTGYETVLTNFSVLPDEAACEHAHLGPAYLENLHRLGLVDILRDETLANDARYGPLRDHPDLVEIKAEIERQGASFSVKRGVVELTPFGRQFAAACVLDHHGTRPPSPAE